MTCCRRSVPQSVDGLGRLDGQPGPRRAGRPRLQHPHRVRRPDPLQHLARPHLPQLVGRSPSAAWSTWSSRRAASADAPSGPPPASGGPGRPRRPGPAGPSPGRRRPGRPAPSASRPPRRRPGPAAGLTRSVRKATASAGLARSLRTAANAAFASGDARSAHTASAWPGPTGRGSQQVPDVHRALRAAGHGLGPVRVEGDRQDDPVVPERRPLPPVATSTHRSRPVVIDRPAGPGRRPTGRTCAGTRTPTGRRRAGDRTPCPAGGRSSASGPANAARTTSRVPSGLNRPPHTPSGAGSIFHSRPAAWSVTNAATSRFFPPPARRGPGRRPATAAARGRRRSAGRPSRAAARRPGRAGEHDLDRCRRPRPSVPWTRNRQTNRPSSDAATGHQGSGVMGMRRPPPQASRHPQRSTSCRLAGPSQAPGLMNTAIRPSADQTSSASPAGGPASAVVVGERALTGRPRPPATHPPPLACTPITYLPSSGNRTPRTDAGAADCGNAQSPTETRSMNPPRPGRASCRPARTRRRRGRQPGDRPFRPGRPGPRPGSVLAGPGQVPGVRREDAAGEVGVAREGPDPRRRPAGREDGHRRVPGPGPDGDPPVRGQAGPVPDVERRPASGNLAATLPVSASRRSACGKPVTANHLPLGVSGRTCL